MSIAADKGLTEECDLPGKNPFRYCSDFVFWRKIKNVSLDSYAAALNYYLMQIQSMLFPHFFVVLYELAICLGVSGERI